VLSEYLRHFENIDHVRFSYEERKLPARYGSLMPVHNDDYQPDLSYEPPFGDIYPHMGAHIGLEIIMIALATSGTYARTMSSQ
jgi:hypothetical protein